MKKLLFPFIFLVSLSVNAQEVAPPLEDIFAVNLNLVGLGVSYERTLGGDFTTIFEADYQLAAIGSGSGGNNVNYAFAANLSLTGRYYYNRIRRFNKSKRLTNNAGNYLALKGNVVPDFTLISNDRFANLETTYGVSALYGLRRNIGRNLNYEFEFGLGYYTSASDHIVLPALQFKLQYVIF